MGKAGATGSAPADLELHVLQRGERELVLLAFTPRRRPHLTEAERDVAIAVARGLTNAEIATTRSASPRTVANQVAAIMRKLAVGSRVELAARLGAADFV